MASNQLLCHCVAFLVEWNVALEIVQGGGITARWWRENRRNVGNPAAVIMTASVMVTERQEN